MINPLIFLASFISIALLSLTVSVKSIHSKNTSTYVSLCLAILLILLIGLRSLDVGVDTRMFYTWTAVGLDFSRKEVLYWNLAAIGNMLYGSIGSLLIISVTSIGLYYFALYKLSKKIERPLNHISYRNDAAPLFCLLAFFVTLASSDFLILNINQVRQGLAASLLVLGCVFYISGEKLKGLIIALSAALAHGSALFIVPFIVLSTLITHRFPIYAFLFFAVISSQIELIKLIIPYIPSDYVKAKFSVEIYQTALTSNVTLTIKTLMTASLILLFDFLKPKQIDLAKIHRKLFNVFSFIMIFSIFILEFGEGSNRVQRYAAVFIPSLLVISFFTIKQKKMSLYLLLSLCLMYFAVMITYPSVLGTIGV